VRAGGRIPLIIGRGLTDRARKALGLDASRVFDCSTKSAEKPKQAKSFNSSRVIGPVVS
jgi:aconitate hydratase 2/2-methylisocitrate dehydratase